MSPSANRPVRPLIVLATVVALLAMPLGASAAPRGKGAILDVTALIGAVSTQAQAAFGVEFTNLGTATLTSPRFTGTASGGTFVSGSNGCTGSGATVTCTAANLAAGASISFVVVFDAPATAGALQLSGTLVIDGGTDNPKASSQDTYKDAATIGVVSSPDFFATWQNAHGNARTFATAAVGGSNTQSTTVSVPAVGFDYPAVVNENSTPIVCAGDPVDGIGQSIDLAVANGEPVSPFLTITVTYHRDVLDGRTPGNVAFVHQRDDGECEFPPRGCDTNAGFCYDAWWSGNGPNKLLVLQAQLPSNGRGRGL